MMIGSPSDEMISRAKKRNKFFHKNGKIIRSQKSRLEAGVEPKSFSLRIVIDYGDDEDLIDFIENCLVLDPSERWTPE